MLQRKVKPLFFLFSNICKRHSVVGSLSHSKAFSTSQVLPSKRHICFSEYDAIGFDCDHTLAQYHLYPLFTDTYASLADFLSNEKGYNRDLFKFNPAFCSKGLILDLDKGDFLKLGHDGRILRASHGTRMITDLHSHFPSLTWPHHLELSRTMTNIGSRYRIFENFFDMASGLLCAQIIDHLDLKHNNNPPSYNVWPDVEDAINHVYIPDPFKATNGMFFSRWLKETDRYVERWSVARREWLKRLKYGGGGGSSVDRSSVGSSVDGGKPLFVLSSAYEDFAGATMAFVFGEDWEDFFDFSIFLAHKPSFFTSDNPFFHLVQGEDGKIETKPVTDLTEDSRFHGGNLKQLQQHLRHITNKQHPKVLFFGDSLRSDVIPSKMYAGWDTVAVVEEMASERCFHSHRPDNLSLEECDVEDTEKMPWGSVLVDGAGKDMTMLHHVVHKYSDIAVPNLEFLLDFPPDHKFETFNSSENPSLSGFHPFIPPILK